MSAELKPRACPFCGHVGLDFAEGSTFRWIVASCGGCGATRGETRIQTLGEGRDEDKWIATARSNAIAEWNRRATPAPGAPGQEAGQKILAELSAEVQRQSGMHAHLQDWDDVFSLIGQLDVLLPAAQEAAAVQAVAQETDRDWSKAQDWKGMDGATAFLLINRHSDGWGDVGAMMNAWLAANAAPSGAGEKP